MTHQWRFGDFRLSVGHDVADFNGLFNQQQGLYGDRIQTSIDGVPNDLLTKVPMCEGSNEQPNQLFFQLISR